MAGNAGGSDNRQLGPRARPPARTRAWPRPPSVGETGLASPGVASGVDGLRLPSGPPSELQPGSATVEAGILGDRAGWTRRSRRPTGQSRARTARLPELQPGPASVGFGKYGVLASRTGRSRRPKGRSRARTACLSGLQPGSASVGPSKAGVQASWTARSRWPSGQSGAGTARLPGLLPGSATVETLEKSKSEHGPLVNLHLPAVWPG